MACLFLLVFVACDDKNVVPEPELLDRAPDPDKGYQYLLARIYGQSFGLTTESVQEIWTVWPPALRDAARNASPEERMQMIYDRYGLLDPPEEDIPGRPPGVPVNLNADTAGVLYTNCLLCHSGKLMGTTIHGMNNTHVAIRTLQNDAILLIINQKLQQLQDSVVARLGRQPRTLEELALLLAEQGIDVALGPGNEELTRLVRELEGFLAASPQGQDSTLNQLIGSRIIRDLLEAYIRFKVPIWSNTDGTSNAFYVAAQWGTFRVGAKGRGSERSPDVTTLPRRDVPPLPQWATETPDWFNSRKKKLYYRDGFIEDTPGDLMQFTMSANHPGDSIRSWYPDFQDLLAWIKALEPPKYEDPQWFGPGSIDQDLARAGLLVFTNNCAQCHGFYGAGGGRFAEEWHNQDIVKTDSTRLYGMGRVYRAFLRDSFFGADGSGPGGKAITVLQPPGYIAPPLDGVWATPPYLHNGAVPSIWHLLRPEGRPKFWTRSENGYDSVRMGLEIQAFDAIPDSVTDDAARRTFYQYNLVGKGIEGHEFPEAPQSLTDDEVMALIEYLKTL